VITASNEADTGKLLSAMTTASTSAGRFGLRHADHLHGAHAVLDPQPAKSVPTGEIIGDATKGRHGSGSKWNWWLMRFG
jgi:hypothetical protein